jgi:broad specificity phosphatase PhoE
MSTLIVVRHGQATYGPDHHDVLSPLGIHQSRRVGQWLAAAGRRPDVIWCGPLNRQVETACHLVAAADPEGNRWPRPVHLEEFREAPMREIFQRSIPQILDEEPELRGASQPEMRMAHVSPTLALRVLERWAADTLDVPSAHSFALFDAQVQRGVARVVEAVDDGACGMVVTSVGPIVLMLRPLLGLDAAAALRLGATVMNAGISELEVTDGRWRLVSFNGADHLAPHERTFI